MNPFIKKYLSDNKGNVLILDEYIANLLINAILTDMEVYGVLDVSPMSGERPVSYWALTEVGILLNDSTVILKATSMFNDNYQGIIDGVQGWLESGDVTELTETETTTLSNYILSNDVDITEVAENLITTTGDGVLQQLVVGTNTSKYRLNLIRNSGKLIVDEYTEFGELKKKCKTQYEVYLLGQITKVINPSDLTLIKLGLDVAGNVVVLVKH